MIKKIFLDFDNTLAHTFYADNEKHADELLYDYTEHFVGEKFQIRNDGWYVSFKRAWTDELLTFTRQLVGMGNVYILTTGTQDYIRWCNVHLKLGFDPNTNIFGREDIFEKETHPLFKESYNILVDDLSYNEHSRGYHKPNHCKVKFLNNIPRSQYVRVKEFTVWTEPLGKNEEYFETVKSKILDALEFIKTEI